MVAKCAVAHSGCVMTPCKAIQDNMHTTCIELWMDLSSAFPKQITGKISDNEKWYTYEAKVQFLRTWGPVILMHNSYGTSSMQNS